MKVSYNWIKDYLKIDYEPAKVAGILTDTGLEVEGTEEWVSVKGGLEGVVIGKVLTCQKHPDADKLSVTTVDIGTGAAHTGCLRSSQCCRRSDCCRCNNGYYHLQRQRTV